ncbi:acyl-CoA dehydrogenase [Rhodococcus sp. AD45-ID]|jgi:alkylation response protein AidB-like acyl-CoA dehydrogenase|uniref:acyl-CoA dehydrogenase family protein n=1 Tax=Rhodococcus TaxID=1827 RepID=UPI0005D361E9|nr:MULTISPECIES: acyl-CoA dehydrogenase family protein [unclassified Rhodococcus (in: high G+C Gram-positive bacteria)]KJF20664.1 Acyl-CoA dehydrogenase, short-chain specific [Rhodococcus sp. AD45]PSR38258.1 acyl-CoA dehydrogenase [Rhodococcus sp. AD45-ID]ROZ44540.1 acyl-CoA dehydrogenase [Rhodococcus sp. WS3]RZL24480.1 MAG: acyl-CoA dehydrogenase [Rhodococcus sp. (in: high G+C Gram-positive bacteria)]
MRRTLFTEDHEAYRDSVREFIAREVSPHYDDWEENRLVDRSAWLAAGKMGIVGLAVPEQYGGSGELDYRYRYIVAEEIARSATTSFGAGLGLQDDIVIPYIADLGTDEQKQRWLPGMAAGEIICAIAMTEPGTGSDLQGIKTTAVRDGDDWILNGQKTFITSGIHADIVIVAARTDPSAGSRGFSLLVVERGMEGFTRGRKLHKVGLAGQDTAELSFENVRVPASNLLGTEGGGLIHLMERLPRERLSIAVSAICVARAAYEWTKAYAFDRSAFGKPIGDFQNTRFALAEMLTEIDVTQAYVDNAVLAINDGELSAVEAAQAKWWASELQKRVVDRCVQLHGGYGYMMEYPIGRAYVDSRIQTIYGGTTEIMKEIIGRDIAKN